MTHISISQRGVATLLALLLAGCGSSETGGNGAAGAGGPGGGRRGPGGPAEVGFVVVQPTSVAQTTELPGRTAAFESSEVRPQVTGLVRRRLFTEGALVRAGQTLYQIDPRVFEAAAAQASANLASATASMEAARVRADRFRPLAEAEAVSKQEYTDALAQSRQTAAQVQQSRAALQAARVNLDFTRVPAPITGRIGRSFSTVGALVTANQATPMAVIQRLDPMFVDIQQSSAALLSLRRMLQKGGSVPASAGVELKLEDGSTYPFRGVVQFTDVTVDPATGTVTLRASFPNPEGLLLPGMFVRAIFAQSIDQNAFLVPQAAVQRDPKGAGSVFIVGPGNKAVARPVTAERTEGANWVVTQGLKAGDKVIVQGVGKLRPNATIRPVPATAPQRLSPRGPGGPGGGRRGGGGGGAGGSGGAN